MLNFSIIIPHKNIPILLQRCLNSIPNRNDLEVIIIDDNSDSDIVNFAHFPGQERSNTTIIFNKESRGGGHVRNLGIDIAKGKWILFADADDFFHSNLDKILSIYTDSTADLIFFNADCVDSTTLQKSSKNRAEHLNKFIEDYAQNKIFGENELRYLFGEPWAKMVKKNIIDKHFIRFDETIIHNDTTFAYLIGYNSKSIIVDSKILYCITERGGSVSKTIDNQRILTRIEVFARAHKFYLEHNIPVRYKYIDRQLAELFLFNRNLYKQCITVIKNQHLATGHFTRRLLIEIPKALGRRYIKRIK